MLRGLYGAAAGMLTQQQRQELLTNNMANANTPGYKADQSSIRSFPEMLLQARNAQSVTGRGYQVGSISTGTYLQEVLPNFRQGSIVETGNGTDLALIDGVLPEGENGQRGMLFFAVQGDDGQARYTRNGQFAVSDSGQLVTTEGHPVLNTAGETIQVEDEEFIVNESGIVTSSAGANLGQIGISYAENPAELVKEGNGLVRAEEELPAAAFDYQIRQRFIEQSNVDANQTMTEMMSALRSFEANQKVLQAYDQSLDKAVNEVGRIG
ncbi:flagellar hook-basal body protein [Alkalicoccobacillus porphyridii]|uniref:Flagellar hook-basal body protein n=1 Tax=Alkalicoccobacillus porphyridii TaxID=2597270 RepID=A0A554A4J6_9BACI|nr:flagellar hook-basal body protein [Alkalicoccobacillus porphyridii]TSB48596.1 flagellar hook-basal body protein [Alkalicoccobacillus porphyridii]